GASDVEQNVGAKFVQRLFHRGKKRTQIFVVIRAIHHIKVDARRRLVRGVIVFLMDGDGEDGIISVKNGGGAVAVVDVSVDDDGFADGFVGLQAADGDGDI